MSCAIKHRGPDEEGIWINPSLGIGLGHTRLAVIDLSKEGNQPMLSQSNRYLIVFNGEIYNHQEIRIDLEAQKKLTFPWRGESDTETLVNAIEAWGIENTLRRCKGMFAFGVFDREKKTLQLARDRFGEKPLYWGEIKGQGIAFASEISAIRAIPEFCNSINEEAVASYKHLGFIPAPQSIYKGIQQLLPGYLLTIEANKLISSYPQSHDLFCWWDTELEALSASKKANNLCFSSYNEGLIALKSSLSEAVKLQSIADVPIGSFLSGGIDSSLITALLQENTKGNVRTFTIGFPDEPLFDEAPFAYAIAKHLGTDHTEVSLTASDATSLIPSLPLIYSEPFADSSQLPTHLLCREARRSGLTVALTGDGGDELFGGYNRHILAPQLQRRLRFAPAPLRNLFKRLLENFPYRLLGMSSDGLAQQKRQKLAFLLTAADSLEDMYAVLLQSCSLTEIDKTFLAPFPNAASAEEKLMLADMLNYLPFDILVKVDRAAMAVGLETRAPFLYPSVAESAWHLTLDYKVRKNNKKFIGKWALRELLKVYLPVKLFERPKAGFAMPIGNWLKGPLNNWANDLLDPCLVKKHGWFNSHEVNKLWKEHKNGNYDHIQRLWPILMAHAWLEEWR